MSVFDVVTMLTMCSTINSSTRQQLYIYKGYPINKEGYNSVCKILPTAVTKAKQLQSECTPLKTHAFSRCRLHNTNNCVASHCVKQTCGNLWQCSQNVTPFPTD